MNFVAYSVVLVIPIITHLLIKNVNGLINLPGNSMITTSSIKFKFRWFIQGIIPKLISKKVELLEHAVYT